MELIFATQNEHKAEELRALIPAQFNMKTLNDIGCTEDIPETADTFAGNALLKSRYVYETYGMSCFGDDSGLQIDALNGEPGVYSARYSGSRDFDRNIQMVLDKLQGVENRTARFRTVIALILDGREYLFEGIIEGRILQERTGERGFGYDPIFTPDGFNMSFAEMSLDQKNRISHRAKALQQMVEFLRQQPA